MDVGGAMPRTAEVAGRAVSKTSAALFLIASVFISGSRCDGMPIRERRSVTSEGYQVQEQSVTLAHGQHRGEGNVQIKYNNQWGAACDDKWSEEDAEVVCRELGFAAAAGLTVSNRFRGAAYRGFSYALDEAACDGTEASVSKCAGRWGKAGNCKQVYEWAGVKCELNKCTPGFSGAYCCPVENGRFSTSKFCCPTGTGGRRCHHSDKVTCFGHGSVDDDGECSCSDGYLGRRCQYSSTSCNGNGKVDEFGICTCNLGFESPYCVPLGQGLQMDASRSSVDRKPVVEASSNGKAKAHAQAAEYEESLPAELRGTKNSAIIVAGLVLSIMMVALAVVLITKKKRVLRQTKPLSETPWSPQDEKKGAVSAPSSGDRVSPVFEVSSPEKPGGRFTTVHNFNSDVNTDDATSPPVKERPKKLRKAKSRVSRKGSETSVSAKMRPGQFDLEGRSPQSDTADEAVVL